MDLTKYYADIIAKYPAYVTKRELCEICHICPKTAYNLEQQGEIPYTIEQNHLIRSHKIKLTDILAYLYRRECRQEADSPYICAMRTFYDKHLSPYGARGQAVYAESLLTGKYIHWERHDFCGIVKPESLKEWLLDKPVRNEAAEELTKFVTPELISAAKQNHTACGYPFLIGYAPAEGGLHEAFCLDPDPVNLASFIVKMGKERGDLMICTPLDTPFLNTFGTFIDRCADQDFLQKHLLPVLVPMQMGETEPQAIKLTEDQDNEAFLDDFAVEDDMEL